MNYDESKVFVKFGPESLMTMVKLNMWWRMGSDEFEMLIKWPLTAVTGPVFSWVPAGFQVDYAMCQVF